MTGGNSPRLIVRSNIVCICRNNRYGIFVALVLVESDELQILCAVVENECRIVLPVLRLIVILRRGVGGVESIRDIVLSINRITGFGIVASDIDGVEYAIRCHQFQHSRIGVGACLFHLDRAIECRQRLLDTSTRYISEGAEVGIEVRYAIRANELGRIVREIECKIAVAQRAIVIGDDKIAAVVAVVEELRIGDVDGFVRYGRNLLSEMYDEERVVGCGVVLRRNLDAPLVGVVLDGCRDGVDVVNRSTAIFFAIGTEEEAPYLRLTRVTLRRIGAIDKG